MGVIKEQQHAGWWKGWGKVVGGVVMAGLVSGGCSTGGVPCRKAAAPVVEAYRAADRLPSGLRRVAVLPMTTGLDGPEWQAGLAALEPMLGVELAGSGRFEVVPVTPARLRQWTGRERWMAHEPLPDDLLAKVREETGCDAILFSHLTVYRAYPPQAQGWRLRLVGGEQGEAVWWATDHVFDAGDAVVAEAARRHRASRSGSLKGLTMGEEVLHTPRYFAEYALSEMLDTCPTR